jgi:iron complex transport system substrate-binding protein
MTKRRLRSIFFVFQLVTVSLLLACQSTSNENHAENSTPIVQIRYAQLFAVKQFRDYTLVNIFTKTDSINPVLQYALVKNTSVKVQENNCMKIQIPIQTAACLGTPHAAMFTALGATAKVKGIAGSQYTTNDSLLAQMQKGLTEEIGTANGEVNMESLIKLSPNIVTLYQESLIEKMKAVGLTAILIKEYEETTPLARAEWIKLIGLLIDQPEAANKLFEEVTQNYNDLKAKAQTATPKPTIFANIPYGNVWYMPANNSFPANYWKDAGANFIWADQNGTGTAPLSIEQVIDKAHQATYWLNVGSYTTLQALVAQDQRFRTFEAVQQQKVFNATLKTSPQGGNAYTELGMIRPDWVLQDLVKIFHPTLLPEHQFIFYQQLK